MARYEDPQLPNKSDGRTYEPPLDMPNRGTKTGFIPGMHDSAGADLNFESINRIGSIASACDSDPMDECYQDAADYKQRNQPGRRATEVSGKSITSACDSDAREDDTPKDQRY